MMNSADRREPNDQDVSASDGSSGAAVHWFRTGLTILSVTMFIAGLSGCVSPADVPQEDVRMTEQDLIAQAVQDVLAEDGWEVAQSVGDGKLVRTDWRPMEGKRRQLEVRISHTSMGFALGTSVETAVPWDGVGAGPEQQTVTIDGEEWVLDQSSRAEEKDVERSIGLQIQSRWKELKHEMRASGDRFDQSRVGHPAPARPDS